MSHERPEGQLDPYHYDADPERLESIDRAEHEGAAFEDEFPVPHFGPHPTVEQQRDEFDAVHRRRAEAVRDGWYVDFWRREGDEEEARRAQEYLDQQMPTLDAFLRGDSTRGRG